MVHYGPLAEGGVSPSTGEITQLLRAWGAGNRQIEDRLFELVLPDLRNLARTLMRRERRDHTLQPTALLNEAYLRLVAARERDWESRQHFIAVAARIMRRLLIDCARARTKTEVLALNANAPVAGPQAEMDLAIAVDRLLDELEAIHPDWCSVVELKYFMGLTDEEAAEALGLRLRTMQRQFSDARRWLFERLNRTPWAKKANATNS